MVDADEIAKLIHGLAWTVRAENEQTVHRNDARPKKAAKYLQFLRTRYPRYFFAVPLGLLDKPVWQKPIPSFLDRRAFNLIKNGWNNA